MPISKIIVLDDDPTGSQTSHSCLLLTKWDEGTLKEALLDASPIFFILTNTRGMSALKAEDLTREVCVNLKKSLSTLKAEDNEISPILVSRSDSTLRGHYPVETDVIASELGGFDAHFLVPAFFEGGRFTRDSMHYLMVDGKETPVHETEFANDSVFSFSTAYLPDYVEEKTKGKIKANEVERFLLDDVRGDSSERLAKLENNVCCAVDCETQKDLNNFAKYLNLATTKGKRFLFRSGASLLTALANLKPQEIPQEEMSKYCVSNNKGALIIGSHVKKTTSQLENILKLDDISPIEVDVNKISDELLDEIIDKANMAHKSNLHIVVYTSRVEKAFSSEKERLEFGEKVSSFLMQIVANLPKTLGFMISKGGITSNDVLSKGLELKTSRVLGQVLAGCSVVKCPSNHKRYPNMPVVIFPGNVGDDNSLVVVLRRLAGVL